jgi:hypothetical protein
MSVTTLTVEIDVDDVLPAISLHAQSECVTTP